MLRLLGRPSGHLPGVTRRLEACRVIHCRCYLAVACLARSKGTSRTVRRLHRGLALVPDAQGVSSL